MKANLHWDDLALFATVARYGRLRLAAKHTGSSPATLSRRMKALESRMARRLFHHGAEGYALTPDGRELLDRTTRMEAAAADIAHWQTQATGPTRVRISAGTWTALHLTDHLADFWTAGAVWVPEFLHCNLDMDIARREIDIGIRNRRPTQPWLAGQRTKDVLYAAYATGPRVTGWIGASGEAAGTRTAQWVAENHANVIVTTTNDPRLALGLAAAGIGRILLPTFVGGSHPSLAQVSAPIADLTSETWLVSHHEGRHDPPVRAALRALARFLCNRESPVK